MKIITCIVLEDEEPARMLMRHYLNKIEDVELTESFDNAVEASDFLERNTVDLIFTDIDMPRLTGLDFIRMLSPRPQVIIITAYPNRANEAYDLDVVDYIVKPVSFERLTKAIDKAKQLLLNSPDIKPSKQEVIFVKEAGKMLKLELNDIIYAEAMSDYVKIITDERPIIAHTTMTKFEEALPKSQFVRVHKSFIINLKKITMIDGADSLVTLSNKIEIPLGRTYKTEFLAKFKPIN